jgi:hypothetical protein
MSIGREPEFSESLQLQEKITQLTSDYSFTNPVILLLSETGLQPVYQ